MEETGVRISDVFSHLTDVERIVIGELGSVFEPWYAVTQAGDVDEEKTSAIFAAWREAYPAFFPMMSQADPRIGGNRHGALMDFGAIHFYGGWKHRFDQTARITRPFWAGEECSIRMGAYVNASSMIGSHTVIGRRVDVGASFIRGHTEIDAFAMVNHSLIGERVYIGPGVKLLHKPLRSIMIATRDHRFCESPFIMTKRRKFGAVVGDGCIIDADAKLHPGAVLLPGCIVPASVEISAGVYTKELIEKRYGRTRP